MFIVMHCGGLPFNGDTIKTKSLGGSETAAYYLAKELAAIGHKVTLFTDSQDSGIFDGVRYEYAGQCTEAAPLGERYTFYAENTPHDINITQRNPRAFERKIASKLNYWWLHDLALLRNKQQCMAHLWNVDRILCVSQWHKKQIVDTWGISADVVVPITNAIDHDLFSGEPESKLVDDGFNLIYSSRPERGLENLVAADGIMARLLATGSAAHLYVCGYDNTTQQMKPYYDYLWSCCDALPNVTRLGSLTKKELADTMRQCSALVYPTQFEEVSCITVMEAMTAGLPIITSEVAALPETLAGSKSKLIPLKEDGSVNLDRFVKAVVKLEAGIVDTTKQAQRDASEKYTWTNVAVMVLADIAQRMAEATALQLQQHFIRHSDIMAFERAREVHGTADAYNVVQNAIDNEYEQGYAFYRDNNFEQHYKNYYQYEKDRGVVYGPEDVTATPRFRAVAEIVSKLQSGAYVMDYGCAHGHFTIPLAKMFPALRFVGVDLAQSNVDSAIAWATDLKLENINFIKTSGTPREVHDVADLDLIIAAEVLEHVAKPKQYVDDLCSLLAPNGQLVLTVPFGPWEAQGYRQHTYWRAHLHHFERQDLHEMMGHFPGFNIMVAPSGYSQFATPLGSYVVSFRKPVDVGGNWDTSARGINYGRKLCETVPDQTLAVCMIVKDAESDLRRCLNSVLPYVQEVVIGIDEATKDGTSHLLEKIKEENPLVAFNVFRMPKATEIGFAAARNLTIERAVSDWILWIDSDEVLTGGHTLVHYLRRNQYNAYAVEQHHWSLDPMMVIQVDLPCRVFRNYKGIKFFGYVHEHPEQAINKGLGEVMLLPVVKIAHHGYKDETVRRARFDRNLGLLVRDRQENPERILGKFLWLRDLAQMCMYDAEAGAADQRVFEVRIREGLALWKELLESGNLRVALDGLKFYSQLVEFSGTGFEFAFSVSASRTPGGIKQPEVIKGFFAKIEDAMTLMRKLAEDKTGQFTSRYY